MVINGGRHEIHINPTDELIRIDAISSSHENASPSKFVIRKKQNPSLPNSETPFKVGRTSGRTMAFILTFMLVSFAAIFIYMALVVTSAQ